MAPLVFLAGLGALAFVANAAAQRRLPHGQNPFDSFPPGVDADDPVSIDVHRASSGRSYRITTFSIPGDGRAYCVAEKKGDIDWLSWLFDPATGKRALWAANADKAGEVEDMKRDLGVES